MAWRQGALSADNMIIDGGKSITDVLRAVVIRMETSLSPHDVEFIWEELDAGEWGLAYESLCEQLYEYDVRADAVSYDDLRNIGVFLKMEPSLWEVLNPSM